MRIPSWSKRRPSRRTQRGTRKSRARRNLFESLEDRRLLAVITVTELSADTTVNGMVSLAEAIQAANTDASVDGSTVGAGADTIEFAPGLNGTITLANELVLTSEIEINGLGTDLITIDGADVTRIFSVPDGAGNVTLRNMTLTNGRSPAIGETRGGAILLDSNNSFVLDNLVISNSDATGDGGAILHAQGNLSITDTQIQGNTSTASGGGLFSNSTGTVSITNSVIDGNQAADKGGGVFRANSLDIGDSTISGNQTTNAEGYGGGLYFMNGDLTISGTTISGNSTAGTNADGGGVMSDTSLASETTTIINSTISGNTSAGRGGGLFNRDGATILSSVTVTGNSATQGSGIASYGDGATQTTVQGSIVAGNTGAGGDVDFTVPNTNSFVTLGYNLIGTGNAIGGFDGTGDTTGVTDPLLDVLADNGGPTFTHGLLANSPAIDSGDPAFDAQLVPTDQRGLARVANNIVDIGAFELALDTGQPTISDIADQVVAEGTATGDIPFTIGDSVTAASALVVTATSSDQNVVPDANIQLGGTDENRTINVTPLPNLSGIAVITVTVTDADNMTITDTFTLIAGNANTPPTITDIADQSIDQDTSAGPITFRVGDLQTALDSLVITAASSDQTLVPDANILVAGTGADRTITLTPLIGLVGSTTITVTVTDEAGLSATDTFVLTVNSVNTSPTITDIVDQATPENTPTQPIFFTIADSETPVSQLTVTATSSNQLLVPDANISLVGTSAIRTIALTPAANQAGTTTITVTVTDAADVSVSDTFVLTVNETNAQPTISDITNQSIVENSSSPAISFTVSDAETPVASLVVTATSSNQTLLPDSGIVISGTGAGRTLTLRPATDQVGTATVSITVTDQDGLSSTDTFLLTVSDMAPPAISGEVFEDADADGQQDPTEVGAFGVRVYVDANDNQVLDTGEEFTTTNALGQYFFTSLPPGDHTIRVEAPNLQVQTSPQAFFGTNLNSITPPQQTQLFEMSTDGTVRLIGSASSDPIDALIRTNSGDFIGARSRNFSDAEDAIYRIDPATGQETLLSRTPIQLAGLAYDPATDTIYTVATDPGAGGALRLHTVNPNTGLLGPAMGNGLVQLGGVSVNDLTFDTVNNRIVGFSGPDPSVGEQFFYEFQLDGTASRLADPALPLNFTGSLAFDGSRFVMFGDIGTQALEVNPDTGELVSSFVASQSLIADSLFFARQGDIAQRVTLAFNDIPNVNFGLASVDTGPAREDFPTLINEILVDPAFNDDEDQLLEFRGQPGGQLNPNTYFVIVDEDSNPGEIHGIFDLSNQPLGSNGFLVLLQQGSIHQVDPASAVLQSTTAGFGGLPGGIYTDSHPISDRIDFILGANAYFLIESNVPPVLGDDIDADDNGLADPFGVKQDWTVLDSVSLHPDFFSGNQAYGDILLAQTDITDPNLRVVELGTPIVVGDGFGYAGRIGDSVGSSADDWVFGTPVAAERNAFSRTTLYELDSGFSSTATPPAFQLRDLDHFGDSNFVGGVRGTIEVAPGLGQTDPNGNPLPVLPAPGLTVLADINFNGVQDTISYIVEPDAGVDPNNAFDINGNEVRFPLTNFYPGVTITATDDQNEPVSSIVETSLEQNFFQPTLNQNYLFSYQGIDTFSTFRRLRFDFYRPVSEVSIDALGSSFGLIPTFGRLDAYDANGVLIDSELSSLLVGQARDTITISSLNEDIAYVVAYADDSIANSTFGRFDRLTYKQSEATAVTDINGEYEIKNLFPGLYEFSVLPDDASSGLIGGLPQQESISRYENFIFNDELRPNVSPEVDPELEFVVNENLAPGTTIGFINAIDLDRQQLGFEILSPNSNGLVVDPLTGELQVGPDADLDFESLPEITLIVGVTDGLAEAATRVKVRLLDVNETPVVEEAVFFVAEDTPSGTTIGQIEAFDPDLSLNQQLVFEVLGGTGENVFSVNPANGLITLVDNTAINFETASELNLLIRVSDSATPPLFTDIDQVIRVIDQNDVPSVATTALTVAENSTGVVGQLFASDPDTLQTHVFELLGGTGAELFQIQRDGAVEVRDGVTIDFEQGSTYTLDVITIDSGAPPLAAEGTVTITITDINEQPSLDQATAVIAENSPGGTPVVTFTITDPENSGSDYQLELLTDEVDGAKFSLDQTTNALTVADGADLDFEAKAVNEVHFLITDPSGNDAPTSVTFFVELTDQNDPPLVVTTELVVSELAAPGTIVGRVEVQIREPDNGDVVSAVIEGGNAASLFTLNSENRILRVADGATFDADGDQQPLSINIRVTDEGGLSSVGTIDIILNDVNEPPIYTGGSLSQAVDSGGAFELIIPADAVVDPEGREFSLAIFGENEQLPDWLEFDEATRTLSGLPTPDLIGTYDLTLRTFEPGPLELFSDVNFQVVVEQGSTPLTNQRDPLDVDANGEVAPIDALRVINFIGRHGNGVSVTEPNPFIGFVDVSGEGIVTARDALLVINGLRRAALSGPFGESVEESLLDVMLQDSDDHDEAVDAALDDLLGPTLF